MNAPFMTAALPVASDTWQLGAYLPIPGHGLLAVNAYLIKGPEPVLIDTGIGALQAEFVEELQKLVDPGDLRWIWLTHMDPDHIGNLRAVLELAPQARLITTFLGAGKLNLWQIEHPHIQLLNPGDNLDLGDRQLQALQPPTFDAPETLACFDGRSRSLFSSDCFGALLTESVESSESVTDENLRDGLASWCQVDTPWLGMVDPDKLKSRCAALRNLQAEVILSGHLPPAGNSRRLVDALITSADVMRNPASPQVAQA